jgi:hypothetical protein
MRSAGSKVGLEEQSDTILNLLIRVQHDTVLLIIDEANRQTTAQFSAARLVEQTAAHASAKHMQLSFTHGPL